MRIREFNVGNVKVGGKKLFLIAGPCVIESLDHCLYMAEEIVKIAYKRSIPYIFKTSYDKANRSSISSYRGPGLEKGLEIIYKVKREFGIPVTSDVHKEKEISPASEVLDLIQIPAFLCRQTDLLLEAAKTKKPINVKKGQFMSPRDMWNVVEKIRSRGNDKIILTERGTTFGYNNLVVDMRSFPIMRSFGYPVVFDATHSVQLPGGKGTSSSGERIFVRYLARAAVGAGCDGLFLEVHNNPDFALCDGPNMITPSELDFILEEVIAISEVLLGRK